MEQIASTFGINSKLLLIQAVNFGVLLFLLHRFLYSPLLKIMDDRQKKIEQGLSDAKQSAAKLADASLRREEIITKAKHEAKELVDKAVAASEKMRDGIMREAEEKAKEIMEYATVQTQEEKKKMMTEVKDEVLGLAVDITEKILGEHVTELRDRKYIERLAENKHENG